MATTIKEKAPARRYSRGSAVTETARPVRGSAPTRSAKRPRLRGYGRTGSKQVVSVRGRRLTNTTADRRTFKFVTVAVLFVIGVIAIAMFLSATSTARSKELSSAQEYEKSLSNKVEVLERDVAYLQSTGEIAHKAAEQGMVNVQQPAILSVGPDGALVEVRPGDPEYQSIIDINGESAARPHAPTSDPQQTENVPGMQAPAIQEANPAQQTSPASAPYAPGASATTAPAPATDQQTPTTEQPAPAPAPEAAAPAAEQPAPVNP